VLAAAAFVPAAPILVPEVAAGAAHELDELREACDAAVETLLDASLDLIVVIANAPTTGPVPGGPRGSLAGFGVPVEVGAGDEPPKLSPAATIGAWFLERCSWAGETLHFGVADDETSARCADLGAALAERAPRLGALVVGDGSACRTEKAPGSFDPRAEGFDLAADQALGSASPADLLALDPDLARDLQAAGRAVWQVAAGMLPSSGMRGRLLRSESPYGVHYAVATWEPADPVE
jgi:hypothetical protein